MKHDSQSSDSVYSLIDVSAGSPPAADSATLLQHEQIRLLRQVVSALDRQSELLEEVVAQTGAAQRQRAAELGQWKQANPELARSCRQAAEALSRIQAAYLSNLTEEVTDHAEDLAEGDFLLTEFVDRFGPRLAHLNSLLQVLSQLSGTP